MAEAVKEYGKKSPVLTDADEQFSAVQWDVASEEPGHTFVLVNTDVTIVWIRDYGALENGRHDVCAHGRVNLAN